MVAGYFEILNADKESWKGLTEKQAEVIQNHLNLVFIHDIDPSIDGGDPKKKQQLNQVHSGKMTLPLHGGDPLARC